MQTSRKWERPSSRPVTRAEQNDAASPDCRSRAPWGSVAVSARPSVRPRIWGAVRSAGATLALPVWGGGHGAGLIRRHRDVPAGPLGRRGCRPNQSLSTAQLASRAGKRSDADHLAAAIRGDAWPCYCHGLLGESRLDTELLGGVYLGGVVGGVGLRVSRW